MIDPFPLVRLWQAVVLQAVQDAVYGLQFRHDARHFIFSANFELLCDVIGLSSAEIRHQIDDPDLYERFRKQLGGRRSADGQEKANH